MAKPSDLASRRSTRRLEELKYDADASELVINLCSIRKLLNFTTNRPSEDGPPRKKVKRSQYKCQCSLTIWDNRPHLGSSNAIVTKHVHSTLSSIDNGQYGPCVLIDLDKSFVIKAEELKIPISRDGANLLEIVDSYFLEFKVIPTRDEIDWPPIPILGKSDGDTYIRDGRLDPKSLAGALVMKYKELPRAPSRSTPLKAFFVTHGVTFKTKYGLEVSAEWRQPSKVTGSPRNTVNSVEESSRATKALATRRKDQDSDDDLTVVETVKRRSTRKAKVIYHFESNTCRSQGVLPQYRKAELLGLGCPACPRFKAKEVEELRFHFLSSHHKYNFVIAEMKEDENSGELREVTFEVNPVPIPKPTTRLIKNEVEFEWVKSSTLFDLAAFLGGDTRWLGTTRKELKAPVRKVLPATIEQVDLAVDQSTQGRGRGSGFLPGDEVRDFRTPLRKKHRMIKLIRRIDDKVATYNSISHRRTHSSEDDMSETDDEVEDEWFIQQHLENLTIAAKDEDWNPMQRELLRRWDRHRLEERLEHTRFLSDSLIRFVRKHKKWLGTSDLQLQAALNQLMDEFARCRLIDAQVSKDVRDMITEAKKNTARTEPTDEALKDDHTATGANGDQSTSIAPEGSATGIPEANLKTIRAVFQTLHKYGHLDIRSGLTQDQLNLLIDHRIPAAQLNREMRHWHEQILKSTQAPAPTGIIEQPPLVDLSPEEELSSHRAKLLSQPPGRCCICSKPVLNAPKEGIHCSAPACPTSSVWFHLNCVKLKRRKPNWSCRACRAEMRLKSLGVEKEAVKRDKGKGRAVDG